MPANFPLMYSRLAPVNAPSPAGGGAGAETRLLSDGIGLNRFLGTFQFAAGTPALGDIIRIHAWGEAR